MQFVSSRLALGVALLAFAAPLTGTAEPKIGVLLKGRSTFWSAMEKGATEEGAKLGATTLVKAPLAETDISVQIQLVIGLGNQGIDALVIAPSNKDALAVPVNALAAKGVKIVVVDSPLAGNASPVFVGTNQHDAGEAAGRLLATLVHDGDEVSFLKHSQGGGATEAREVGALAKLREAHPGITVHGDIYASSEKGVEAERAELVLTKYPNTKAILASGTPGTMAMMQKLKEKKLGGTVKLVGFGFNLNQEVADAIESGVLQGWIAQLPKDVGAKGVGGGGGGGGFL
jgi:ribose transport system substrate-binding protein